MTRALALIMVLMLGLAACSPTIQRAGSPGAGFAGPRLEDKAFVSFDGARLGLSHWDAEGGEPWAVIVGLHGMNDYANAFRLAGPYWAKDGVTTIAFDQRGFGRSPERGIWGGDALMVEDLRTLVALVKAKYPQAIVAVVGESMGGAVAIEAFASDRPPAADRLVLLAPAVWGWSNQPLPNKTALWLTARLAPGSVIKPPRWITEHVSASDNREELIRMGRDPLMIWGSRSDTLYGLVSMMERAWSSIGRIRTPTLYLYGYNDEVIPKGPTFEAARRLKPDDRSGYYRDGWHLLLIDKQAERVWRDVEGYIRDPAAPLTSRVATIPDAPTPSNNPARTVTAEASSGL